jgi:2-dehydro-3-deoxy-D-gluconate 5-dehydrogenase
VSELDDLVGKARGAPLFDLGGKNALVVGGTTGLGQAMALGLARAGADVCVAGLGTQGMEETAAAIAALGRSGASISVDVTDESRVEDLMREVADRLGGIDILVNSQGAVHLQASTEFDMTEWQRVIDVNLKSVVLCCKHAGRRMLAAGRGKIINISSVRAFQGRAQDLAYAPSKGAINQLTRSLAIEWGPRGINVNAIAPVFTLTAINRALLADPAKLEWVMSRIPMKRLGELEDLFGPVIFLASAASNFVNGHTLPVDGGWLGA